jgi:ABC-type dipeptide/oligopeptide/nickel transport system ATPase component
MRIGKQIQRLLKARGLRSGREVRSRDLLISVGIPDTDRVLRAYPHQLSGGMNQRVMVALAIAAEPKLLIADEPTTGLDVTVQAQILDLFKHTTASSGRGVLFITHDLGVVAQMCDRVVVMNQGKIVETGTVGQIFHDPAEAYTRELIASATAEVGRMARMEVKQ